MILDAKNRKMWQFPTPQKRPPLDIIAYFPTQLFRSGRSTQHIRTDGGGELARSSEFCALLKDKFQIGVERTGTYSSWLNGKVERHIQTACGMLRIGTVDHDLGDKIWCCKCEDVTQKYNATIHTAHNECPDTLWYERKPCAWEFRVFGCKVEAKIGTHLAQLDPRSENGYFLGTTATKAVIRYFKPEEPNTIHYCVTAKFYEYITYLPNGQLSPGSALTQGHPQPPTPTPTSINITDHPFINSPPYIFTMALPLKDTCLGITLSECQYHNLPYICSSSHKCIFQKSVPHDLRHNVWILAIGNNNPITEKQVLIDITAL
jgi:hypothetical protein